MYDAIVKAVSQGCQVSIPPLFFQEALGALRAYGIRYTYKLNDDGEYSVRGKYVGIAE